MGLNPTPEPRPLPDDELDLLAAHAIGAVDPGEQLAVEAALITDDRAAAITSALEEAAAELAAATPVDEAPPPGLRARVLDAALAIRPGGRFDVASSREVHRVEAARLLTTLARLDDAAWQRPVDPPEFAGWTVHDLVVHVATAEVLFAQLLGLPTPGVPETLNANDERTALAQARHRSLTPAVAVAELERAAAAIDAHVADLTDDDLEREIEWWGVPMRISTVLVHRGFETWIHHDDVRRAVGLGESAPPAATIAAMSRRAVGWLPLMLAAGGHDATGRSARLVLDGPGGGSYTVDLTDGALVPGAAGGPDAGRAAHGDVDVELRAGIVELCQAVGNRVPAGGLRYEARGDEDLAAALVESLPLLAAL